jgi:LCP family protein required for cell wall assembly
VVAVCLLAAASLYAYVSYRFGQIHRVTVHGLSSAPAPGGRAGGIGGGSAGPPINILVVGSDTRAGLSDASRLGGGSVGGARSDTMMIVHLNPAAGSASLLSIPRDLWVPIQGWGYQRINAAFNNGPDLLVRTIEDDLGIPINHYVDVDFDSFRQVVNAVGGVKFWYPEPIRDNDLGVNDSGLNITAPGCYTLNGGMGLSLVRTRHLQYYDNGAWHFEAESDLARIRRQQLFIKKVATKAEALGLTDLTKINGVLGGVVSNLTIDSGFSQSEMIALARRYRNFNTSSLPTATLPTTPTVIGGADVLLLQKGPAQQVINLWEGIQAPAAAASSTTTAAPATGIDASTITVGVLNGSGVSHQATEAANALRVAGFNASISGTGAAPSFAYRSSVIDYGPGGEANAQLLQTEIAGGAQLRADRNLNPGALVLITGATYLGIDPGAAPTTSTTAPSSAASALAAAPGNTSSAPAFPGAHGQDPPPPGSGC